MSQTPGRSVQSYLITSVGVANLVFGGLFVAFGLYCLLAGGDAVATLFQAKDEVAKAGAAVGVSVPPADAKQLNDLGDLGAKGLSGVILAMVGVVAGCSMLQGAPLLLVGAGVLGRRNWARVLALVFAVLAGIEGLACLSSVSQSRAFLLSGIVLPAYAVLSFVGLLGRRASAEFSGRADPYEAERNPSPPIPFSQAARGDRFGGETAPQAGPPPIPPLHRRTLAVPILGAVAAAATLAAAIFAYLHFAAPAPQTAPPSQGKPTADGPGARPVANAPRAKPADWLPDLMAAAEGGQPSRILDAVARGAVVDEKNELGETALMKAAVKGHVAASALLLGLGAQINEQDGKGQTPLMLAAENGHDALVDLFLGNEAGGVNFEAIRQQALMATPVDLDKIAKDPSKALNLKLPPLEAFKPPHAEVDAQDAEGQTAFMKAVANGRHDITVRLLQHGAKGDRTDNTGNSILHLVAGKGNLDDLKHFVNAGNNTLYYYPDPVKQDPYVTIGDLPNSQGMQAWMLAAAGGHLEALKRLLPADAPKEEVNRKGRDGKTALDLAAAKGHQDVVDYLKPLAGVNVAVVVAPPPPPPQPPPAPAPKEPSPLMKAVDAGDLDAVQALLTAGGISADDRDDEDKTVLMHAAAKGDSKIVLLLTAAAGKTLGAEYVERKDKEGRTALIHAAVGGHTAAVEALLFAVSAEWDRGRLNWFTPLNTRDKSGKTALEQAEARSDKATVDLLRAFVKDNLNVRSTTNGKTALEDMSERGDLASVAALLKFGASKDSADPGLSALMLAAGKGHARVVQALLDSFADDKAARKQYVALVANPSAAKPVTALIIATENGHIVVVQELLDAFGDDKEARMNYLQVPTTSTDPNTGSADSVPALTVANRANHKEIAAMLKKYGATP